VSAAALVLIALADVVSIGWARPDDPLEWIQVVQYPSACLSAGAVVDTVAMVPASAEPFATFRQPAQPRCYCYRIRSWTPRGASVVADHEHCSRAATSCH